MAEEKKPRVKMMKLKLKRVEKGMTMKALGEKVNVKPGTIYLWESGYRHPKKNNLQKLADSLGCSVEDLI